MRYKLKVAIGLLIKDSHTKNNHVKILWSGRELLEERIGGAIHRFFIRFVPFKKYGFFTFVLNIVFRKGLIKSRTLKNNRVIYCSAAHKYTLLNPYV